MSTTGTVCSAECNHESLPPDSGSHVVTKSCLSSRTTVIDSDRLQPVFSANAPLQPLQTTAEVPACPPVIPALLHIGRRQIILSMDAQPQTPDEVTLKQSLRRFGQEVQWFTNMISSETEMWMKILTTKLDAMVQCSFFTHRVDHLIVTFAGTQNREYYPDNIVLTLGSTVEEITATRRQLHESVQNLHQSLQLKSMTGQPYALDSNASQISRLISELKDCFGKIKKILKKLEEDLMLLQTLYPLAFEACLPCLKALLANGLKEEIKKMLSADQSNDHTAAVLTTRLDPSIGDDRALLDNLTTIARNQAMQVVNEITIVAKYLFIFEYQLTHDLSQCQGTIQDEIHTVRIAANLASPTRNINRAVPLDQRHITIHGLFIHQPTNALGFSSSLLTAPCAIHFNSGSNDDYVFRIIYRHLLETLQLFRQNAFNLLEITPQEIVSTTPNIMSSHLLFNEGSSPLDPFRRFFGQSISLCEASVPSFLNKTHELIRLIKTSITQTAIPSGKTSDISNVDLLIEEAIQHEHHFQQIIEDIIEELENLKNGLLEIMKGLCNFAFLNNFKEVQAQLSEMLIEAQTSSHKLLFLKLTLIQYIVKAKSKLVILLQLLKQRALFLNARGQTLVNNSEQVLEERHLIISTSPLLSAASNPPTSQVTVAAPKNSVDCLQPDAPLPPCTSETRLDNDNSTSALEKKKAPYAAIQTTPPPQALSRLHALATSTFPQPQTNALCKAQLSTHSQIASPVIHIGPSQITLNMDAQPQNADDVTLIDHLQCFEQKMQWLVKMISGESGTWLTILTTQFNAITQCSFFTNRVDRLIFKFAQASEDHYNLEGLKHSLEETLEAIAQMSTKCCESVQDLQKCITNSLQLKGLVDRLKLTTPFEINSNESPIPQLICEINDRVLAVENILNELEGQLSIIQIHYLPAFEACLPTLIILLQKGLREEFRKLVANDQASDHSAEILTSHLNPAFPHDTILNNFELIACTQAMHVVDLITIFKQQLDIFRYQLTRDLQQFQESFQEVHLTTTAIQVAREIPLDQRKITIRGLFANEAPNNQPSTISLDFNPNLNEEPIFRLILSHSQKALNTFIGYISETLGSIVPDIIETTDKIHTYHPLFTDDSTSPLCMWKELMDLCNTTTGGFLSDAISLMQSICEYNEQTSRPMNTLSETPINLDLLIQEVLQHETLFQTRIDAIISQLEGLKKGLMQIMEKLSSMEQTGQLSNDLQKLLLEITDLFIETEACMYKLKFVKPNLQQYVVNANMKLAPLLQLLKQRILFHNGSEQAPPDDIGQSYQGQTTLIPDRLAPQALTAEEQSSSVQMQPSTPRSESTPDTSSDNNVSTQALKNRKKKARRQRQRAKKAELSITQKRDQAAIPPPQSISNPPHAIATAESPRQQTDGHCEDLLSTHSSQQSASSDAAESSPADAQSQTSVPEASLLLDKPTTYPRIIIENPTDEQGEKIKDNTSREGLNKDLPPILAYQQSASPKVVESSPADAQSQTSVPEATLLLEEPTTFPRIIIENPTDEQGEEIKDNTSREGLNEDLPPTLAYQQSASPEVAESSPPDAQSQTSVPEASMLLEDPTTFPRIIIENPTDEQAAIITEAFLAIDFKNIPQDQTPRLLQLLDALNNKLTNHTNDPIDWKNLKVKFRTEISKSNEGQTY